MSQGAYLMTNFFFVYVFELFLIFWRKPFYARLQNVWYEAHLYFTFVIISSDGNDSASERLHEAMDSLPFTGMKFNVIFKQWIFFRWFMSVIKVATLQKKCGLCVFFLQCCYRYKPHEWSKKAFIVYITSFF